MATFISESLEISNQERPAIMNGALALALVLKACAAYVCSKAGPGLEESRLSALMSFQSTTKWLLGEMGVKPIKLIQASA